MKDRQRLSVGKTLLYATLGVALAAGAGVVFVPQLRASVVPQATQTSTQPAPTGFVQPSPTDPVAPLLTALPGEPAPAADALAARLPQLPRGVAAPAGVAFGAAGGEGAYAARATQAFIPASTMKLLTTAVALETLGPDRRFDTRVVSEGNRIVLVGGGDPLLTAKAGPHGSLAELAQRTAAQLTASGRVKISLGYDTSLFSGPGWHPSWSKNYAYSVAPISALTVDHGVTANGPRVTDPARAAAARFATLLAKKGIRATVSGPVRASKGAEQIAVVSSLTVERIVEETLRNSDNDAAEQLLRQLAVASGKPGSFVGGAAAMRSGLVRLGLWGTGLRISDGCGLSRDNRVTPAVLEKLIRVALSETSSLHSLLDDLPVAGVSGTLQDRFDDKGEAAARGSVRAKTGSLRDVSALAGYLITKDGAVLTFAVMLNGITRPEAARDWIDRTLARVTSCGCG